MFTWKSIPFFFGSFCNLYRIRPNVIFVHDVNLFLFTAILYNILFKSKVVFDCHSEINKDGITVIGKLYHSFFAAAFKLFSSSISVFYGIAPECVSFIHKYYKIKKDRIKLLPLPSKKSEALSSSQNRLLRKKYRIDKNKKIILHVGKLPGKKNTTSVLKAFSQLDPAEFQLVIAGSIEDEFERKQKFYLDKENIHFIGWIHPKEVRKLMVISHILVQPGSNSNIFIDAICSSLPIILRKSPQSDFLLMGKNGLSINSISKDCEDELLANEINMKILQIDRDYQMFKQNAEKQSHVFDYKSIARITINDYLS